MGAPARRPARSVSPRAASPVRRASRRAPVATGSAESARARAVERPAAEDDRLSLLFGEMMSHLNRRTAGDTLRMMNEHGLSMAQMVTLLALAHVSVLSVSAIAQILRLSLPATSHLVDRLVRAELVRRSEDPEDRRAKRVALTARGTSFVRKLEAARTREVAQVFNHLSSEARARLGDTLVLVIAELASLPCRTVTGPASGAGAGSRSSRAREPGPSGTLASSKPGPSVRG